MCYDVETKLRRDLDLAIRKGAASEDIDYLRHKLDKYLDTFGEETLDALEHYWSMGFQHQKIPVITNEDPEDLQFFHWGLIPFWVKDAKSARVIAGKCLNARSETMFEKPAFRAAAKARRCVIPLSGYYEHHWVDSKGKKKVPYYVRHADLKPLFMAGLWETWTNPENNEQINTCAICTCSANEALSKVHNRNPHDPRMLVIMPLESVADWLSEIETKEDVDLLKNVCEPYPQELLEMYPVRQLRGALGVGDVQEASEPFEYNIIGLP